MRPIDKIVLHTSYTPEGREHDVDDIDAWHKANGWSGVGYHFVVKIDGTVQVGRPLDKIGAHTKGKNQGSIGVCYIGGMNAEDRKPKDTRTEAQKEALIDLCEGLSLTFGGLTVYGHNEFSTKSCPCFDVKAEFRDVKDPKFTMPLMHEDRVSRKPQ